MDGAKSVNTLISTINTFILRDNSLILDAIEFHRVIGAL